MRLPHTAVSHAKDVAHELSSTLTSAAMLLTEWFGTRVGARTPGRQTVALGPPLEASLPRVTRGHSGGSRGPGRRTGGRGVQLPGQRPGHEPAETAEAYAAGTPLRVLFGEHAEPLVVAAVLSEPGTEFTATDIAGLAGVEERQAGKHILTMVELDLVETAGSEGSTTTFRLREDDQSVRSLWDVEEDLASKLLPEESADGPARHAR
jgi:hypothetical protein